METENQPLTYLTETEKNLRKLLSRCVWELREHNNDSRHITDKLFIQQIQDECPIDNPYIPILKV